MKTKSTTSDREFNLMDNELRDGTEWIIEDLQKSGLDLTTFPVTPLTSESELIGFLGDSGWSPRQLIETGGYFIEYPNVPGFKRLKLRKEIGSAKYLSPKGKGNNPYITIEVKKLFSDYNPDKPLLITEGEKKAAKATNEGFPTIGLSGVWNFKDRQCDFLPELEELNLKYRRCYIVFDSDITDKHNVRLAEIQLAVELINRQAEALSIRLPNEDNGVKNGLDDFLVRHGREAFRDLIQGAVPTLELHMKEGTPADLIIKAIAKIKPNIKRAELIKEMAGIKHISVDILRKEVDIHTEKEPSKHEQSEEEFSEDDMKAAEELLRSKNIMEKMLSLTERSGYVGEEINKIMLYLAFTSRLMDNSISCIVKGSSASGKSSLVNTVLNMFPKAEVLKYSFLTAKALVHFQGSLSHKILFIQEHNGGESADYSIRTSLSEGEISISYPVKNETTGEFETRDKLVDAKGLVYVETTTRDHIHDENQTRVFDLYIDESEEQTGRILETEAMEIDQQKIEKELKIWRAAQKILKPHPVSIPFAKMLVKPFPKDKVRSRRDFKRFLSLIKVHAFLHQYQRKSDGQGRILATAEDLRSILPIVGKVLSDSVKPYSPKREQILKVIKDEFDRCDFSFGELKEKAGDIHPRTLRRDIKQFEEDGIIDWNGERGRKSKYSLSTASGLSPFNNFSINVLKSLELFEDTDCCPQMSPLSSKKSIKDINDNKEQNVMSSNISNDNGCMALNNVVEDIGTSEFLRTARRI